MIKNKIETSKKMKEIGEKLKGNIIHNEWLTQIVDEKGRADVNTCLILAEIVYLYRPDQKGGKWVTKYKDDALYKPYSDLEARLNLGRFQIERSINKLEKMNIIKKDFRTQSYKAGNQIKLKHNVLYILLDVDELEKISFPKIEEIEGIEIEGIEELDEMKTNDGLEKEENPYRFQDRYPIGSDTDTLSVSRPIPYRFQDRYPIGSDTDTNTQNTTQNTTQKTTEEDNKKSISSPTPLNSLVNINKNKNNNNNNESYPIVNINNNKNNNNNNESYPIVNINNNKNNNNESIKTNIELIKDQLDTRELELFELFLIDSKIMNIKSENIERNVISVKNWIKMNITKEDIKQAITIMLKSKDKQGNQYPLSNTYSIDSWLTTVLQNKQKSNETTSNKKPNRRADINLADLLNNNNDEIELDGVEID